MAVSLSFPFTNSRTALKIYWVRLNKYSSIELARYIPKSILVTSFQLIFKIYTILADYYVQIVLLQTVLVFISSTTRTVPQCLTPLRVQIPCSQHICAIHFLHITKNIFSSNIFNNCFNIVRAKTFLLINHNMNLSRQWYERLWKLDSITL